jgi:hypothetical protein
VTVTRIAGRRRAVILERISDQWTLAGQSVLVTKYAEFLSDARRDLPARALRAVSTGDAQTASELLAEPVYHTTLAAMQDLADYYECFSVREVLFDE